MENEIMNNEEVMNEVEVVEEENSGNGTGLGFVIGSAVTLAIIAGVKGFKKAKAWYKAKKEQSESTSNDSESVDDEIDSEETD